MSVACSDPSVQVLLLRAHAYSLCAQLLSERTGAQDASAAAQELARVLRRLRKEGHASRLNPSSLAAVAPLLGSQDYLRPFLSGAISPYETTYGVDAGGGKTFQLADIAGFYGAFGFQVAAERPDHIVPELEFVALLLAKEAYARMSGEHDNGNVCADARRKLTGEHLGAWLPELARKVAEQVPDSPLSVVIESVCAVVGR